MDDRKGERVGARVHGPCYRLRDNLDDDEQSACVTATERSCGVTDAVVYCLAVASGLNGGNSDMSVQAVADMLVRFYGFKAGASSPWAVDIDIWEERKKHFRKGRALQSYHDLLDDPSWYRDGLREAVEGATSAIRAA